MLLCVATNFCPSTAHRRNFFALLRYDEQTKLLVEIESVSARTSPSLTVANASTNEQQLFWLLLLLRASPIIMGLPLAVNSASAAAPWS
jgi:hypothetical protein